MRITNEQSKSDSLIIELNMLKSVRFESYGYNNCGTIQGNEEQSSRRTKAKTDLSDLDTDDT